MMQIAANVQGSNLYLESAGVTSCPWTARRAQHIAVNRHLDLVLAHACTQQVLVFGGPAFQEVLGSYLLALTGIFDRIISISGCWY